MIDSKVLKRANQLYDGGLFDDCLGLLYLNCFETKFWVWFLILFFYLLAGVSIFASIIVQNLPINSGVTVDVVAVVASVASASIASAIIVAVFAGAIVASVASASIAGAAVVVVVAVVASIASASIASAVIAGAVVAVIAVAVAVAVADKLVQTICKKILKKWRGEQKLEGIKKYFVKNKKRILKKRKKDDVLKDKISSKNMNECKKCNTIFIGHICPSCWDCCEKYQ